VAEIHIEQDDGSSHHWTVDENDEKFDRLEALIHELYGVADTMWL
jgi:hypothetical protein